MENPLLEDEEETTEDIRRGTTADEDRSVSFQPFTMWTSLIHQNISVVLQLIM